MTITARFPGRCRRCGGAIAIGERIEWDNRVATHIDVATCERTRAANRETSPRQDGAPIVAFLNAAKARGLKFPKVRFLAPGGGELRLSIAGDMSRYPGSVQVKHDDNWIGRIEPDGVVAGPLSGDAYAAVRAELSAIASDPAGKARAYGALMGRCSFCDKTLTDDGSVEVGYGPICARKYGLPHTARGTRTVQEVA